MNRITCVALSSLFASSTAFAAPATAFVHVNVVPMDREHVLRNQTVLVRGDRIVAVGRDVTVPADAERIDGHGRAWLSPGLADMHTHSQTKNDLAIYLSSGVKPASTMASASRFIDIMMVRAAPPRISALTFMFRFVDHNTHHNGFVGTPTVEARAIVGLAKTNGYDFIKV